MADPHDFGRFCEGVAARWLQRRGWRILHRNYRLGHREIDLIARRGGVIAFIEVKGRRNPEFGHPLEAITKRKRREIERVARRWLAGHPACGQVLRFDAVAIQLSGSRIRVQHVEDAWRLEA